MFHYGYLRGWSHGGGHGFTDADGGGRGLGWATQMNFHYDNHDNDGTGCGWTGGEFGDGLCANGDGGGSTHGRAFAVQHRSAIEALSWIYLGGIP